MDGGQSTERAILVVEDDQDTREMLGVALEYAGFKVVTATNGRDAIDRLRGAAELPGLILLDLSMPVMDGLRFRREQLGDARLASIPVVILSAERDVTHAARNLDANGYLIKPFAFEVLIDTVKRHRQRAAEISTAKTPRFEVF